MKHVLLMITLLCLLPVVCSAEDFKVVDLSKVDMKDATYDDGVLTLNNSKSVVSIPLSSAPTTIACMLVLGPGLSFLRARDYRPGKVGQAVATVTIDHKKRKVFCASITKQNKLIRGQVFDLPASVGPGKVCTIQVDFGPGKYRVWLNEERMGDVNLSRGGHTFDASKVNSIMIRGNLRVEGIVWR